MGFWMCRWWTEQESMMWATWSAVAPKFQVWASGLREVACVEMEVTGGAGLGGGSEEVICTGWLWHAGGSQGGSQAGLSVFMSFSFLICEVGESPGPSWSSRDQMRGKDSKFWGLMFSLVVKMAECHDGGPRFKSLLWLLIPTSCWCWWGPWMDVLALAWSNFWHLESEPLDENSASVSASQIM